MLIHHPHCFIRIPNTDPYTDRVPGIGGSWHRGIRRAYTPFKRHIPCAGADSTKVNEDQTDCVVL